MDSRNVAVGSDRPEAYSVSVTDQWKQAVGRFPDHIAIQCGEVCRTYREMDGLVETLAAGIGQALGQQRGATVALLSRRTDWTCITMLAIWRVGAVYAPLSSENPTERNVEALRICRPGLLVVDEAISLPQDLPLEFPGMVIATRQDLLAKMDGVTGHLPACLPPRHEDLAYLMFTSGSTGSPKGVMVGHAGMLNHLSAKIDDFQIDSQSVVAQNASQGFDISIWQFLAALMVGGKTVVYRQEMVLNPAAFLAALQTDRVSVLELVPSYLSLLLKYIYSAPERHAFPDLKFLVLNAETLPLKMVEQWLSRFPGVPIANTYGATETSDDVGHYLMHSPPQYATVPVMARPIPNHRIYVLDASGAPCLPGEVGEIHIAGIGVGKGYLGNPSATHAVFGMDPFDPTCRRRIYKTNDLGRLWADGTLEFCGRTDRQVKIDGQRVELEEIEHRIAAHPDVIHAVVVAETVEGRHTRLKAFWMARNPVSAPTMQAHLAQSLPPYAIPGLLRELPAFPVNSNGKIDLLALQGL